MKRLLTLATIVLAGLSLAACGNNSKEAKDNSSLKAENSSLKAKKKEAENSSLKAENESLKQQKQDDSDSKTSSTTSSQKITSVNNADDAVQLAKQTYGDNNGDWKWGYMKDEDGNPSMIDGGYFVKAISRSMDPNGSQTAKSIVVYPDGSIKDN